MRQEQPQASDPPAVNIRKSASFNDQSVDLLLDPGLTGAVRCRLTDASLVGG